MASVLRRSWILDFCTGRRKPSSSPSVQIVRVVRRAPWTEVVLSDKFHTVRAILEPDALARFLGDNGNLTLAKMVGTIVLLHEYALGGLEGILVVRVDRFSLLCGEPMAAVGEPVDVMSLGEVKIAAIAWQPSQESSASQAGVPSSDELPIIAGGQPPPPPAAEAARLMDMADTEDVSAILAVADACTQDPAADAAAELDEDGFRAPPPPTPAAVTPVRSQATDAGSSCPDSGVSYASTSSSATVVGHPRPLMVSTTRAVRATREHIVAVFDPRAELVRAADCLVPPEQHNRLARLPGWPAEPLVTATGDGESTFASQSQQSPRRRLSSNLSQSSDVLQLSQQSFSQMPPTPTPTVPLQQPRPTLSTESTDDDESAVVPDSARKAVVIATTSQAPSADGGETVPRPAAEQPAVAMTPSTAASQQRTPEVRTPSTEDVVALRVNETPERPAIPTVAETPPEAAPGEPRAPAEPEDVVSQALSSSSDESDGVQCLLKTPPKRKVAHDTATLLLEDVSSANSSPSQTRVTESQTQLAPSAELFTMPETQPQQRLRFSTAQPLSYEPPSFTDEDEHEASSDGNESGGSTQAPGKRTRRNSDGDSSESSVRSLLLESDYRGVGMTEMEIEDAEHAARTGVAPPQRRKRRRIDCTSSIAHEYGQAAPPIWLATDVSEDATAAVRRVLGDAKPADTPVSFSWLVSLARRFSSAGLIGSM